MYESIKIKKMRKLVFGTLIVFAMSFVVSCETPDYNEELSINKEDVQTPGEKTYAIDKEDVVTPGEKG